MASRYQQRCKRCGRFFKSACPYDEFCTYSCYADDRAELEARERSRAENMKALQALAEAS